MHLILHKKIHRDGNIVCDLCEFITRGRFTFQKHLAIKHNIGQVYSCTLCDHKTGGVSGKGHLKTHMERHNKEKDHMCDKCDFKSGTESSLKKHLQRHKENYKYLCDVCDYKSHDFSNFQAHKKTKHSSIVLSCEECDFTTKSDRTFRNHNSKHSTSLNCGNCDYKTNSRMALRHHKTINLHRNWFRFENPNFCSGVIWAYYSHKSVMRKQKFGFELVVLKVYIEMEGLFFGSKCKSLVIKCVYVLSIIFTLPPNSFSSHKTHN